ncbi:MAG: ABC transporter ATP-binding protein/permease [Thermomicrobiales bacterium]|nr:ABC transporter ATP-binding protein/permease [Thermomicrobiales bacterium]MCO5219565.1 ABC transporter ATP-binding protein/permease [Thermomicrobiales bacterium]
MGPGPGPGGPGARFKEAPEVKNRKETVRRLWQYLKHERLRLIVAVVLIIGTSALGLVGPLLMGRAIDDYIIPGDMNGLARLMLIMLAVYLGNSLLMWLQALIMSQVAQRTVHLLRTDIFAKLQRLPLRFFDTRPHGDTMSRVTNDVETISQILTEGASQIVSSVLTGVGVIVLMLILEPTLAVISIGSLVILSLVVNRYIGPRTRVGFREQQKHLGTLNGLIEETISGQRTVMAYNQENDRIEQFLEQNETLRQHSVRAQTFAGVVGPIMNFVNNFSIAMVAGAGGWLVVDGRTTVGVVATFLSYTRQLSQPVNQISQMYNQLQSALAGAERIFEILDEPDEIDAASHEIGHQAITRGEVEFRDVSFSYDGVTPILKHVSLHAEPGSVTALVGPTGAGKTTIINLITRFYEIDSGHILIDGTDLKDINKVELRRQLGIVLQDGFLFAGTVMENIRYGRLDASDEDVIEAAKMAQADDFISHLPDGYDTELTERGGNVSQGQRQLITIARALLANPRILILDEATSNVDTRTERYIQEGMTRLMQGRTSFVIAHRLSTIRGADQILVINQGEVIERGTHTELLEQGGFYARLSGSQSGGGDEEILRAEEEEELRAMARAQAQQ